MQARAKKTYFTFVMCTEEDDVVEGYNKCVDPIWGCDISDDYQSEKKEVRRSLAQRWTDARARRESSDGGRTRAARSLRRGVSSLRHTQHADGGGGGVSRRPIQRSVLEREGGVRRQEPLARVKRNRSARAAGRGLWVPMMMMMMP